MIAAFLPSNVSGWCASSGPHPPSPSPKMGRGGAERSEVGVRAARGSHQVHVNNTAFAQR